MARKKRPSTQNEISTTLRLLKLKLREHPENIRVEAADECLRALKILRDEFEAANMQRLFNKNEAEK